MELLVPIFCLLLLVSLVFYVGYPLVGVATPFGLREGEHQRLIERREQLLAAIKEIEFDQAMGKLPEGEYQHFRRQFEAEAMAVLHQLDLLKSSAGQTGGGLAARVEKDIRALRQKDQSHCSSCGAQRQPADHFCSRCGARFAEAGTA
jgi:hypothetical protein